MAEELGLPCEDECAAGSFPNMPDSIHPGVLSGQAQLDLYQHAKENGKFRQAAISLGAGVAERRLGFFVRCI
jgi:hypothetical protein